MKAADLPELRALSVAEKLVLVEDLWDQIAAQPETLEIPAWHKQALEKSLAEYRENPREGAPWAEVKARILGRA